MVVVVNIIKNEFPAHMEGTLSYNSKLVIFISPTSLQQSRYQNSKKWLKAYLMPLISR